MVDLPDEIWQFIFYLATDNPARRESEHDGPMELEPFETFQEGEDRDSAREAFEVKISISIVSAKWRNLSAKFLFEDIRIRQGSYALARKLDEPITPSSNITFGAYVRRTIIRVGGAGVWTKTLEASARRIVLACPNTQILARRQESCKARYPRQHESKNKAIDDVQMPRLRRVDWNNSPAHRPQIHGIPTFVWGVPTLEILSASDHMQSQAREKAADRG